MRRKGVTLLEVCCCLLIIGMLCSLLTPAFQSALKAGKMAVTASNLRQLYIAISQYRVDYSGDGVYGSTTSMGLATVEQVFNHRYGLPLRIWKSPCGDHPSMPPTLMNYSYFPGDGSALWDRDIGLFQEDMYLIGDMNCSDPDVYLWNEYQDKVGRGVMLGGRMVAKRRKGDYFMPSWWADPIVPIGQDRSAGLASGRKNP